MNNDNDGLGPVTKLRPRPTTEVVLDIPDSVLVSLERVAKERDMSLRALVHLYIGEGLREDQSRIRRGHFDEIAEKVLIQRLESDEEASAIIKEIRERITELA